MIVEIKNRKSPSDIHIPFKVGVDWDDTSITHFELLIRYLNEVWGLKINYEEITGTSWGKKYGLGPNDENSIMYGFWHFRPEDGQPPYYERGKPIDGATEGLAAIARIGGQSAVITARLKHQQAFTKSQMNRFFPGFFPLGDHYSENPYHGGKGKTKPQIARKLGVDIAIEDSYYQARAYASAGIPVVLLEKPWNREYDLTEGMTRVPSWEQIVEQVQRNKMIKESKALNGYRVYR